MRVINYPLGFGDIPQIPEVNEGFWSRTEGEMIQTSDVRSCIVVAAHNPVSKVGYLGHFTLDYAMTVDTPFSEMVDAVQAEETEVPFEAWISGATSLNTPGFGADVLDEYHKMNQLGRLLTVRSLDSIGVRPIKDEWLGKNERIERVLFDSNAGIIHYSTDEID